MVLSTHHHSWRWFIGINPGTPLQDVALFRDLPAEARRELCEMAVRHSLPRRVMLFLQGDAGTNLYIVESGKLKVVAENSAGRHVILNVLGPGDSFGELALLDGEPRSATVTTITETNLLSIAQEPFLSFLATRPELAIAVARNLAGQVRRLSNSVRDLALLDVYGRVSSTLSELAGDADHIRPKPTHQELASMIGSSREMVSRVMRELSLGGYVETRRDAIYLRRPLPPAW